MTTPSDAFPRDIVPDLLAAGDTIRRSLATYFSSDPEVGFTGRYFEQMIGRSDPLQFTPWDIVAVGTLSVDIPALVAGTLLLPGPTRDRTTGLLIELAQCSPTLDEASDDEIGDGSAAGQLYWLLRDLPGMGPTRASKLLAAKRPGLIPIRDSVVESLLQAGNAWWKPMRELARNQRLRTLIDEASLGVVPEHVTFLRRLDVVLWSYGRNTPRSPEQGSGPLNI